jgi:CRISPR-associated endoribonuclease Cas6
MLHLTLTFSPTNGRIDGRHVTARGLHGLLFDVLQRADQAEASWLHYHESPKPFSLVPLYSEDGVLVGMRLAAITERTAALFTKAWEKARREGEVLRLGRYQTFIAQEVVCQPGLSFAELALLPPDEQMGLSFLSPTAFKQGPGHLTLPLPANVFGWPLRVWQAFAPSPVDVSERWLDWCAADVFVVRHQIETATVSIGRQEPFTGFVGDVWFEAMGGSEVYLRVWQALGRLATFCGVGHKTTMGMGAVEWLERNHRNSEFRANQG